MNKSKPQCQSQPQAKIAERPLKNTQQIEAAVERLEEAMNLFEEIKPSAKSTHCPPPPPSPHSKQLLLKLKRQLQNF